VSGAFGRAFSVYAGLWSAAEGAGGKSEVVAAFARAVVSRLRHGRGALHVRRPIVIATGGVRWWVPALDSSFASTAPGSDNGAVLPELLSLLASRPQPVVIDIGANIGFVSMSLARRHPERRIVAVEPVPWLADALRRTAALNGFAHVTVVERAVADVERLAFDVPHVDGVHLTTLASGAARSSDEAATVEHERIEVRGAGLDAIVDELGIAPADIACVKIDVEGAEAPALATGARALSARPPVVFEAFGDAQRTAVEDVLRGFGYTRFRAVDRSDFVATA
jgi:FkbM family methyltransferase